MRAPPENEAPRGWATGLRENVHAGGLDASGYKENPTDLQAAVETRFRGLQTLSLWIEEVRHKLRRGELLLDLGQLDEADQEALEADVADLMQVMIAFIAERRAT